MAPWHWCSERWYSFASPARLPLLSSRTSNIDRRESDQKLTKPKIIDDGKQKQKTPRHLIHLELKKSRGKPMSVPVESL
jgi:hypothetical protein